MATKHTAKDPYAPDAPYTFPERYFRALGGFIHVFSATERQLKFLVWHFAGLSSYKGRALLSGIKTDESIGHIKKLIEKKGQNIRSDLEDVLAQLGEINKVRNHILHQEVTKIQTRQIVLSNEKSVFRKAAVKKIVASPEILQAMTRDLEKIQAHLSIYLKPKSLATKLYSARLLSVSWQYKSAPQSNRFRSQKARNSTRTNRGRPLQP